MKKKKSGGGGADWMDTYGDMVTLLLCFFVLLYSMSTIDQEAWKNLVMSFNPYAVADVLPVQNESKGPSTDGEDSGVAPTPDQDKIDEMIEDLFLAFQAYAEESGQSENITVSRDEGGRVYVNFRDTTFFDPNSPQLRREAYPVLDETIKILMEAGPAIDQVRIQGHTAQSSANPKDTVRTDRSLSSNRACNVLIYIQEHSDWNVLDPARLVSEGLGQWHPIKDNESEEGRAANRRVELIISGRNLEEEMAEGIESYSTKNYTTAGQTDASGGPAADRRAETVTGVNKLEADAAGAPHTTAKDHTTATARKSIG